MKLLENRYTIKRFLVALLLTLPLAYGFYYTTGVVGLQNPQLDLIEKGGILFHYFGSVLLLFLIFYKDKIDFFRKVIFVPAAACFTLWFVLYLFHERGHLFIYTPEDVNCGNVPFCHIVIPQTLLPTVLTGKFIFPGTTSKWIFSMFGMIATWIGVSLVLGRGFCSWACFWGGWESGSASILKKPIIKRIPMKLKWGAFAMLFSIVISSLVSLTVVYCIWLCPFQGVSEFAQVTDWVTTLKFVLFAVIFLFLVIIFPLLTKKRVQCISFCPFGAFQSLVDKINAFDIRIKTKECSGCKKCIRECPMNAVTEESLKTGKIGIPCVKCGKCVDVCHKKAVVFHLKGTPVGYLSKAVKVTFIYLSFFALTMMLGGNIKEALVIIFKFIFTGSTV